MSLQLNLLFYNVIRHNVGHHAQDMKLEEEEGRSRGFKVNGVCLPSNRNENDSFSHLAWDSQYQLICNQTEREYNKESDLTARKMSKSLFIY